MPGNIDISIVCAPVRATADGEVTNAGMGTGKTRDCLNHGTMFTCMASFVVAVIPGSTKRAAGESAMSASRGGSTGPQLHYEVRPAHVPVNPKYLRTNHAKVAISTARQRFLTPQPELSTFRSADGRCAPLCTTVQPLLV